MKQTLLRILSLLWLGCIPAVYAQQYPDPKRFENEILAFEAQDKVSPPPTGAIVLTGSSSIARIHTALPQTRIYVLSIKPSVLRKPRWGTAQKVNAAYRKLAAKDPLVHYVDVASSLLSNNGEVMTDIFVPDNLHLNELGNAIWGAAIKAALMPMEAREERASGG